MCIAVFLWKAHPLHPFILLLNRDEFHSRPTIPLSWWEDHPRILGGRDALANGTWLACSRRGKIAFLTNVREIKSQAQVKSRGDLPVRFLESEKNPEEFADELVHEADQYNGFNLVIADLCSLTMFYITNRPKSEGATANLVSPGIHVLSNAKLDTPWPKAQRLEKSFTSLMHRFGNSEVPLKELNEEGIMNDRTKDDDESELPHIYSPEFEYQLSSIFIDSFETPSGPYGTRSTSTVIATTNGDLTFSEKYLDKGSWKEMTISFQIVKETETANEEVQEQRIAT